MVPGLTKRVVPLVGAGQGQDRYNSIGMLFRVLQYTLYHRKVSTQRISQGSPGVGTIIRRDLYHLMETQL